MRFRPVLIALAAAALPALLPSLAAAQFPPPPPPTIQNRWPDPPGVRRPPPPQTEAPAQQTPAQRAPARRSSPRAAPRDATAPPVRKPKPTAPAHVVACGGVFGKDSTHRKLAGRYDSRNVVFTDVDAQDGSKIKASVLFPRDPKRRLEVVWQNETSRSNILVIDINGKSNWVAPKGLRLGLSLAALEKNNGRPFQLSGLGPDGTASVTDWGNGALAALPGGCKVGVRLTADRAAPEAARKAVSGGRSLLSNDRALRAVKPTVVEILIGY